MRLRFYSFLLVLLLLVPMTARAQFALPDGSVGLLDATAFSRVVFAVEDDVPTKILLEQNYPNPFSDETQIQFTLPQAMEVSLRVLNVLGREVKVLVNGRLDAGTHAAVFNAGDLPAGLYLYRLEASDQVQVRRMLLIK